ncbi:MAG TPA: glycosyltransferase family 1 protein [Gaiellaceae bacterium]|nr:glycosyltransferase family 1 protein [Gaiellaceae bacterium]
MVGIALLTLVPGELGGSETATRGLLRGLARVGTLDYRTFVPPVAADAGEGLPTEVVAEYRRAHTIPERLLAMTLAAARPGRLRRRLAGVDVVHYPLTIALPPASVPSVVTLYDVQHLDLPRMFPRAERLFRGLAYDRSARAAARVVVSSDFVRRRAIERLGLDSDRIRVIPFGIDHQRFRPDDEHREPFLLYPARPWPHKNHERLFHAFGLLRRVRPDLRLVLTGGGHTGQPPRGVEVHGQVSGDELVSLYRRASALVFPSLYEGFGQPPLEAMACGCPVVCSNVASLPEVCGDAARYFDPHDVDEIADAVLDVLTDPEPWRERGLARAAEFTWERTARAHEEVYRELL